MDNGEQRIIGSISYFSEIVLYLQCRDEGVRKQFINVSECFFNGHAVKFIAWYPNFNLESLDALCLVWIHIMSMLPELKQLEILKTIGFELGDLLGIDNSYLYDNDVRMLFRIKFNQALQGLTKFVTRNASYDFHLLPLKGKISEIIKMDKGTKTNFDTLPSTSDLQKFFTKFREQSMSSRVELYKSNPSNMVEKHHKEDRVSLKGIKVDSDCRKQIITQIQEHPDRSAEYCDPSGPSSRQQQMINDLASNPIKPRTLEQTVAMDSVSLMYGMQLKGDAGVSYDNNIEDIENRMLFEVDPDSRKPDQPIKEKYSTEKCQLLDSSKIAPNKVFQNKASKFWQAPSEIRSSPFTPIELVPKLKDYDCEGSLTKMVQVFLNREDNMETELYEESDENLHQLTDELVQVFSFEDINNSSKDQKVALIQRIINLGGWTYTCDDLRRDLISIEAKDKANRQRIDRKVPAQGNRVDNSTKNGEVEDLQADIINKIIKELELENTEGKITQQYNKDSRLEKATKYLGIQQNQESLSSPNFGKSKGRRGRRSLKDLREAEGLSSEQQKIDQLFNIGKGKCLPKEP